jgi:hypothetical protein
MPVDVVEHFLTRVDQRVKRTDALFPDGDAQRGIASRVLDPGDGQSIDQSRAVDATVRHIAGPGVARQVIQLVHIERAGQNAAQQSVGRRQIGSIGIDKVGDPTRIDAPCLFQDGSDLRPLDQTPAATFVRNDRRP